MRGSHFNFTLIFLTLVANANSVEDDLRHRLSKEILKEAAKQRLEDDSFLDKITFEEARARMKGEEDFNMLDDILKVKEAVRSYLEANESHYWLKTKVSEAPINDVSQEIIKKIIPVLFGSLVDSIEELIDRIENVLDDIIDAFLPELRGALEEVIKTIEEDLRAALEFISDSDWEGIVGWFSDPTLEAFQDIRHVFSTMVIIMSIICTFFSMSTIVHLVDMIADAVIGKKWEDLTSKKKKKISSPCQLSPDVIFS